MRQMPCMPASSADEMRPHGTGSHPHPRCHDSRSTCWAKVLLQAECEQELGGKEGRGHQGVRQVVQERRAIALDPVTDELNDPAATKQSRKTPRLTARGWCASPPPPREGAPRAPPWRGRSRGRAQVPAEHRRDRSMAKLIRRRRRCRAQVPGEPEARRRLPARRRSGSAWCGGGDRSPRTPPCPRRAI